MSRTLGLFALALFRIFDAWAARRLGAPSVADLRYTPASVLAALGPSPRPPASALPLPPVASPCACPVCACYRQTLVEVSGARFVYVVWPTVPQ